ncbi:bifunctional UDP-N-acetylglucosamine diphosphorylase/glucosamine-1-phosphate N-acetyltransferase GlmU [Aliarcobacter butzleri]|uniref:bifunctional UDP-N-acetylglucosamine diphosphorylase/glucosamine-1-phosphate N-acetyltransferase GlmU n=1 Tax=Aliarcobacter butzleri TaxID=28197 RepID=UPI00263EA3F0|nr:bifunctional UDP-N-acetylglucosamine diphosphorylase/glucosamine-1-phosphate N-acetyltransferase GlmU [Aliarcobacter butzleri]MDN5078713.1 bifunctional UDP-N-acetylglucosamine diphosphorylase/glucosamine-1-phosphate N-acetyltransferase GlmU [Aliarcobacter butzleri]MDN5119869.1 bifunctional UDP-N-acetylglucosamine diphosphorylase/glucosamine-1-phosphate N-acetyltransferase GlmU [Aliarcobacter butzleri]
MGKKSIIILAAGAGTRMKSDTPKVLHKISGKPMLYYSIKEALKLSDDITVVLYHQFEKVKAEIEKYFSNINFVIQDHKNYPGTGGAVMGIVPKYEKVLVLNGDMPLIQANELEKFEINATIVMSVLELESADGYGRVIIENGNVKKIVEQKDASEDELKITTANAGIYQFETKFLLENLPKLDNNNAQKEYYITDLVEMAISQGKVLKPLVVNEENFKGVNSKVELADAEVIHQNRIKKEFMKAGVIMRLPDTIYIEEGVEIEGESIIENGVSLLGNAKIINSHIKTNSVVEDSIVKDSEVGPMGRVRPGSELTNTHIGNFVETKKAKLTGVKAGHLSYLGDCSIDEGTNIGCGTITCNYDGVNKHQTIIGKNVFVGSDTQFVAPVNIEDDVLIGAGSTVTGNVKKGELYLTRAKAKIIDGFFYKHFSSKKK